MYFLQKEKKKARVHQIGGNFEEFGEGEIGDVMEAMKRSKMDLKNCGRDGVGNQSTQVGSSLGGSSGQTAEYAMSCHGWYGGLVQNRWVRSDAGIWLVRWGSCGRGEAWGCLGCCGYRIPSKDRQTACWV